MQYWFRLIKEGILDQSHEIINEIYNNIKGEYSFSFLEKKDYNDIFEDTIINLFDILKEKISIQELLHSLYYYSNSKFTFKYLKIQKLIIKLINELKDMFIVRDLLSDIITIDTSGVYSPFINERHWIKQNAIGYS